MALSRGSVVYKAILDDITSAINEQRKPTTKKEPEKKKGGLPTPPALLILSKIPEKGSKVAQVAAAKNTIGVFAKPVNQVTGVKLEGLLDWNSRADFINRVGVAGLFSLSVFGLVGKPLLDNKLANDAVVAKQKKAEAEKAAADAKAKAEKDAADAQAAEKKKAADDKKAAEVAAEKQKRQDIMDSATAERQKIIEKGYYYKSRSTADVVAESRARREALLQTYVVNRRASTD